jgi:hypothetical protein
MITYIIHTFENNLCQSLCVNPLAVKPYNSFFPDLKCVNNGPYLYNCSLFLSIDF